MNISDITGSREPSDNWTSLYTFVFGCIAGGFIAIGLGDVDQSQELDGLLLKIYLPLITALLGSGIGLFASRSGDRISDRRKQKRAILLLLNDLQSVAAAIMAYRMAIPEKGPETPWAYTIDEALLLLVSAETVKRAASRQPTFADTIDDIEDLEQSAQIRRIFAHAERFFSHNPTAGRSEADVITEAIRALSDEGRTSIDEMIGDIAVATNHFARRLASL